MAAGGGDLPGAVLFACNRNAVRSPMAAAILKHLAGRPHLCGFGGRARRRTTDPFAAAVMEEIGIDLSRHKPKSLAGVHDGSFDLIVSLSPEAHHKALQLAAASPSMSNIGRRQDPSLPSGSREQILDAYRALRDRLFRKIKSRFKLAGGPSV